MNQTIIISGVGFRTELDYSNIGNIFSNEKVKQNIGCAVAKKLAEESYNVILLSKTKQKLEIVQKSLYELTGRNKGIDIKSIDILDSTQIKNFVDSLPHNSEFHYVHSAGLSSGSYDIENPYLELEDTPIDLPTQEFRAVVESLLIMSKHLVPRLKTQKVSRMIIINSMSGIRPYPMGYSHSSAKAGLHNATRSMTLELTKDNIFITEINPGMVDTGHYDNPKVQKSIKVISRTFGYIHEELPLMPPESIAEVVLLAIKSKAHVLNINLVSQGQIPHLGA